MICKAVAARLAQRKIEVPTEKSEALAQRGHGVVDNHVAKTPKTHMRSKRKKTINQHSNEDKLILINDSNAA